MNGLDLRSVMIERRGRGRGREREQKKKQKTKRFRGAGKETDEIERTKGDARKRVEQNEGTGRAGGCGRGGVAARRCEKIITNK